MDPADNWVRKIGWQKLFCVNKACAHFGHEIGQALPGYHSITGCDATPFPFRVETHSPVLRDMMLRMNTINVPNHLTLTLAMLIVIREKIILTIQTRVLIQTVIKYWCGFI